MSHLWVIVWAQIFSHSFGTPFLVMVWIMAMIEAWYHRFGSNLLVTVTRISNHFSRSSGVAGPCRRQPSSSCTTADGPYEMRTSRSYTSMETEHSSSCKLDQVTLTPATQPLHVLRNGLKHRILHAEPRYPSGLILRWCTVCQQRKFLLLFISRRESLGPKNRDLCLYPQCTINKVISSTFRYQQNNKILKSHIQTYCIITQYQ